MRAVRVGAGCYFLAATSLCTTLWIFSASGLAAQDAHFHNAPTSSSQQRIRMRGRRQPSRQAQNSMRRTAARVTESMDAAPGTFKLLARGATQEAPEGEVFWFITILTGSVNNGMPS